jgi:putative Holliday junction resolvase
MRVMAIDYGDARTGIALSDPTGTITGRAWVVSERRPEKLAAVIKQAAQENGVSTIVLGFPRNMNGTVGPRAEKCESFALTLKEATGLPVILCDAHRILSENDRHGKKRRSRIDAVAASLILEAYLASL